MLGIKGGSQIEKATVQRDKAEMGKAPMKSEQHLSPRNSIGADHISEQTEESAQTEHIFACFLAG